MCWSKFGHVSNISYPKGASSIPSQPSKCPQASPSTPRFGGGTVPRGKPPMDEGMKSQVLPGTRPIPVAPSPTSPSSPTPALRPHSPKCYAHKKPPPPYPPVTHCGLYNLLHLNVLRLLFFCHHHLRICHTQLSPARLRALGVKDNASPPATEHRVSKVLKSVWWLTF